MDKEEKEVSLEDLYWATLSKNDIIRILKDNCSKNIILEKQKSDLEAKLAESERLLKKHCYKNIQELEDVFNYNLNQVAILSQQLAEKEKEHEFLIDQYEEETEKLRKQIKQESDARKRFVEEVKNLKQQLTEKEQEIEELRFRERNINGLIEQLPNQNQTAIAELEKVKEWLEPKYFDKEQINYLTNVIDQQIAELKGEK